MVGKSCLPSGIWLIPLSEISRAYFAKGGFEGLHLILYGIIAVLVVLFMPKGIIYYAKKWLNPILKLDENNPVYTEKGKEAEAES